MVHFVQFVQFSGDPKTSLGYLQQIVPPAIFNLVIQGFAAIAKAKVRTSRVVPSRTRFMVLVLASIATRICCSRFRNGLVVHRDCHAHSC